MGGRLRHDRRSTRWRGFDYTSPGAYFITIATHRRARLFGEIIGGTMRLSAHGEVVRTEWYRSTTVRPRMALDAFVVMPDHVHGMVLLGETAWTDLTTRPTRGWPAQLDSSPSGEAPPRGPRPGSLGAFVGGFKAAVTRRINRARGTAGFPVWQRGYRDCVIRDVVALSRMRAYIASHCQPPP